VVIVNKKYYTVISIDNQQGFAENFMDLCNKNSNIINDCHYTKNVSIYLLHILPCNDFEMKEL